MLYAAESITELEGPSRSAVWVSRVKYIATSRRIVGKTGTPSLDRAQDFHFCRPFDYLLTVLAALDCKTKSTNWGTARCSDESIRVPLNSSVYNRSEKQKQQGSVSQHMTYHLRQSFSDLAYANTRDLKSISVRQYATSHLRQSSDLAYDNTRDPNRSQYVNT